MTRLFLRFTLISAVFLASCSGASNTGTLGSNAAIPGNRHTVRQTTYTQKLLVANAGNSSILAFGIPTSGGNVAPTQDIHGSDTELHSPSSVAVGGLGRIYANRYSPGRVTRYDSDADGDAAPDLSALDTEIGPLGLFVSGTGLWVTIYEISAPAEVLEYSTSAQGAATPLNSITGSNTLLGYDSSVALDSSGYIYVTTGVNYYGYCTSYSSAYILVFAPSASGNVAPDHKIHGSHTNLCAPTQVTIDNSTYGSGRILVSDANGHVLVFAAGASGNATPIQDITTIAHPAGVTTDSSGNIYVSAPGNNKIDVFAPGATGNATPSMTISGTYTNLSSPQQLVMGTY